MSEQAYRLNNSPSFALVPADDFTLAAGGAKGRTAFVVLAALRLHLNQQTGLCCPSIDRLAEICGLSSRAVRSSVRYLEAEGYLTVERGNGRNHTSRYYPRERVKPGSGFSAERVSAASGFSAERVKPDAERVKPASGEQRIEHTNSSPSEKGTGDSGKGGKDNPAAQAYNALPEEIRQGFDTLKKPHGLIGKLLSETEKGKYPGGWEALVNDVHNWGLARNLPPEAYPRAFNGFLKRSGEYDKPKSPPTRTPVSGNAEKFAEIDRLMAEGGA